MNDLSRYLEKEADSKNGRSQNKTLTIMRITLKAKRKCLLFYKSCSREAAMHCGAFNRLTCAQTVSWSL